MSAIREKGEAAKKMFCFCTELQLGVLKNSSICVYNLAVLPIIGSQDSSLVLFWFGMRRSVYREAFEGELTGF